MSIINSHMRWNQFKQITLILPLQGSTSRGQRERILGDRILFCSCPPGSGGAAKGAPSVYGQRNEASIAGSRGARCRQVSPKDKSLKECKTRAKTNILNWVSNARGQTMSRN